MLMQGRGSFIGKFSAPGVPTVDYVVGRTSANPLKKIVAPVSLTPIVTGISTSSVTIGAASGTRSFVINGGLASFDIDGAVKFASTANNANYIAGRALSWDGTTLVVTVGAVIILSGGGSQAAVGGSGTYSDWQLELNLPATGAYHEVQGLQIGTNTADFTVSDWDYRGTTICNYIIGSKHILFDQCIGDFSNTTLLGTGAIFGQRVGASSFSVTNTTWDGMGISGAFAMLARGLQLFNRNKFINLPTDCWQNSGDTQDFGNPINFTENYVHGLASASGHADGIQLPQFTVGSALNITNNVILLPTKAPPGSGGLTAPLNINAELADWTTPTNINNNILIGGSYNIYATLNPGRSNTSAITFGENMYVAGAENGILYPVLQVMPGVTIQGFRNANTNAGPLSFLYNYDGAHPSNSVTSVP